MSPLRKFISYAKPYIHLYVIATIGGFVKFLLPLVFPSVLAYLIDNVFTPSTALSNIDKIKTLNLTIIKMLSLYVFIWAPSTFFRSYIAGKAGQKVIFDLRYDLYQHIQRMSASYFSKNHSGGIVSKLVNDIALAQNLLGAALTNVWMDSALLVVLLVILFKMSVPMTLVALSIMPVYIVVNQYISRRVKKNSRAIQDEIEAFQGNLNEKIAGNTIVKAFNAEKIEEERYLKETKSLLNHSVEGSRLNAYNQSFVGLITSVAPMLVVWFAGYNIINSKLSVGQLVAFYSYLQQFYFPLNRFAELSVILSNSLAAIDRIFEVFSLEPDVKEKEKATVMGKVEGRIEFKDVSFSYDADTPILKGINLTINPGEKVAFVGSSGAGKTTITNLIPRFYDVSSGQILIDGTDISNVTLNSLRSNIAMVLQDNILFSGTLRDNIAYGKPKATKKDILSVSKAARVDEFIDMLSDGYDTEVGERGTKLSGGQKQRIAIARAFLKNPKILILDEATSALDSESENKIQEALNMLMKERTTLIIAHRLSTIINADKIVVINKGEIAEIGTHSELLDKNGIYRHLYDEQFKDTDEMAAV